MLPIPDLTVINIITKYLKLTIFTEQNGTFL